MIYCDFFFVFAIWSGSQILAARNANKIENLLESEELVKTLESRLQLKQINSTRAKKKKTNEKQSKEWNIEMDGWMAECRVVLSSYRCAPLECRLLLVQHLQSYDIVHSTSAAITRLFRRESFERKKKRKTKKELSIVFVVALFFSHRALYRTYERFFFLFVFNFNKLLCL